MRRIGIIEKSSQATRFCDYLITLGIQATSEPTDDQDAPDRRAIWVQEEPKVDAAKLALAEFLQAPDDSQYSVSGEAAKRRAEQAAENKRRLKNQKSVQHRSFTGTGNAKRPTVILFTIAICIAAGLFTNFGSPRPQVTPQGRLVPSTEMQVFETMKFVSADDAKRTEDPFASIRNGQVWRLITPTMLHGSIGHLAMNMLGLFMIGGAIERIQGKATIAILLVVTALAGTVVQAIWPVWNNGGPNGIGASGAAYGLLGYVWIRPFYDPDFSLYIPPSGLILAMMFLLLGIADIVHGIANGAHVGGLVAGMIMATLIRSSTRGGSR